MSKLKITPKRISGAIILALPFIGLAAFVWHRDGPMVVLFAFSGALFIAGAIYFGLKLMFD